MIRKNTIYSSFIALYKPVWLKVWLLLSPGWNSLQLSLIGMREFFWRWKLTSIRLIWHPAKLIESYEKMSLGGAEAEYFSCFHSSCQLGNKCYMIESVNPVTWLMCWGSFNNYIHWRKEKSTNCQLKSKPFSILVSCKRCYFLEKKVSLLKGDITYC